MSNVPEEGKKRIMLQSKIKYDRGNFFLASQGLFANAYATLVVAAITTDKIIGWYAGLPIIICLIGILLNIAWIYSNRFKDDELKSEFKLPELNLTDVINKVVPYLLIVGWIALMFFFAAQYYGFIKISAP